MIKKVVKRLLGHFLRRYRLPPRPGFIEVVDDVSRATLKLMWREDSMMETQFFRYGLYGSWERHSLRIWAHLSACATEILDVGANTGIYSLVARKNNPAAIIVAIEPIALNADVLTSNVEANRADVRIERAAMSDAPGGAVMYMIKDRLNYMTSVNDDRYAKHPEIAGGAAIVPVDVPTIDWPGLQAKLGLKGPDLIKIDVEGHEDAVMRSMKVHVAAHRPTILIEIIGDANAAALQDMLAGLGYCFFAIDESAGRAVSVAELWDNDHQNFLVCLPRVASDLARKGLVDQVLGAVA